MKFETLKRPVRDVVVALLLLTRLPLPKLPDAAFEDAARAVWAYPLVGLVIGFAASLIAALCVQIGLSPALTVAMCLGFLIVVSGAMHEDGLADCADGFWGGYDKKRRLDIMKDSRIGTYGVLALVILTGVRGVALAALIPQGLGAIIAACVLSRGAMPVLMFYVPHARSDGLSVHVGRPRLSPVLAGGAIAVTLAFLSIGSGAVGATIVALCAAACVGALAARKIGGQTGDVLGAAQQLSEAAILCFAVTLVA